MWYEFCIVSSMHTAKATKQIRIAHPQSFSRFQWSAIYILMIFAVIYVGLKIRSGQEALVNRLQQSYRNVTMKDLENESLKAQIKDLGGKLAGIERRYDRALRKSLSLAEEYKEKIRVLQNKVEDLKTEHEILQNEADVREIALRSQDPYIY